MSTDFFFPEHDYSIFLKKFNLICKFPCRHFKNQKEKKFPINNATQLPSLLRLLSRHFNSIPLYCYTLLLSLNTLSNESITPPNKIFALQHFKHKTIYCKWQGCDTASVSEPERQVFCKSAYTKYTKSFWLRMYVCMCVVACCLVRNTRNLTNITMPRSIQQQIALESK